MVIYGYMDGNYKLIRWYFVLHGGIDGFSRTIVYFACVDNNMQGLLPVHNLFLEFLEFSKTCEM